MAVVAAAGSIAVETENRIKIRKKSIKAKIIAMAVYGAAATVAAAAAVIATVVIAALTSYDGLKNSSCIKNKKMKFCSAQYETTSTPNVSLCSFQDPQEKWGLLNTV
jgi:hypothetical protein